MKTILDQMLHTWSTGGWVMIALAALSVLIYGTAVHLLMTLHHRGLKKATDDDLRRWMQDPDTAPPRIGEMIRFTQTQVGSLEDVEGRFREWESRKVPGVDRKIAVLGVMVVAAPLFGLLGTVLGMLLTFKAISVGGSSVSEVVAKGISEALVATQTGLTVAIPGWMAAFVAKRWRAEYVGFLLRLEACSLRYHRDYFSGMTRVFTRRDVPASRVRPPTGATVEPTLEPVHAP